MVTRRLGLLAFALWALSCGGRKPAQQVAGQGEGVEYAVTAGPGARELLVEARFPRSETAELSVDTLAEPFVRDVAIDDGHGFRSLAPEGTSWFAKACTEGSCRVRYRYLLGDAAAALGDVDRAAAFGDTLLAPPSTWLLRPIALRSGTPVALRVDPGVGIRFVSGFFLDPAGHYLADAADLPEAPYSGFGRFREQSLKVGERSVEIALAPGELGASDADILRWVERGVTAVTGFYGQFPLQRALVVVVPGQGNELSGKTLGNGGGSIVLFHGRGVPAQARDLDWIATHELVHLAFPSLQRRHLWLEEGLSTYVEPIARVMAGQLDEETAWRDLIVGMPNGLPEEGDQGLDRTPTWGRLYWGGALFCLLADVEIRRRTDDTRGLPDALRRIVTRGGNVAVRWSIKEALDVGDQATGVRVLSELYAKMAEAPAPVDLSAMWKELGVGLRGSRVVFDDRAPLASIRRSIMRAR